MVLASRFFGNDDGEAFQLGNFGKGAVRGDEEVEEAARAVPQC